MKFIVAVHFELGYPQELVAAMLGMKQPSLMDEIALIQRVILGKEYKPKKKNPLEELSTQDAINQLDEVNYL